MKIVIYTLNLDVVYENSILFINYCYQGLINLIALVNI